mgnify:CR=1 FL=1
MSMQGETVPAVREEGQGSPMRQPTKGVRQGRGSPQQQGKGQRGEPGHSVPGLQHPLGMTRLSAEYDKL